MILLVDNYDSYTFNLAHLVAQAAGHEPLVVPAGEPADLPQRVRAGEFSHVVISPGPGTPEREEDFGASRRVIEAAADADIPLLGVCLGHQGLAMLAGAAVTRAPEPRHGFVSTVTHSGEGIFAGIPQDFEVVRYHSLHVDKVPSITVHARSEDGVIQALKVDGLNHWGVQFHPESVLTQHGAAIMRNFLGGWRLLHREVPGVLDCQRVFNAIRCDGNDAFFLDSADARGRFSILGDTAGTLSRSMSYSLDDGNVLDTLDAELSTPVVDAPDLPFTGGWIGYLGYECAQLTMPITLRHHSPYPDAYFVRPQSFIVYDHQAETAHLCALAGDGDTGLLDRLEQALKGAEGAGGTSIGEGSWSNPDYLGSIERAQELLRAGESYEVCLTDTFTAEATGDIYPSLREHNPAPYAAHLIFDGVEVASASPERFLTVRGREVEAKPIKGTIAADQDPALLDDAKTRAENLMIVDLLRNDLSRVCDPGTVRVPGLMQVESYATVHQLVSTITGRLCEGRTAVDAIRATFPPGSMTGAPKLRTCEIIDRLETSPRGVYSGALGYFGFDGQADLSVVIRTAVRAGNSVTVGAGGAIVLASDPDSELVERNLKAQSVLGAWDA
ncbi:Aminodeoxychorismate synthase component 1 [Corynebacterium afermentans subsp. afermentans]|uniref:aminodeoxychorismate synthase n=1 Tax=Corynebacterium afermentans TaxID=38286 RepID=A0A9X8NAI0_9CORY|nr:chorismate-binding protein [Corynebacterium afermentans]OAA15947.1 aminobenzoate synthetase [Corynebacterium afermentans subsp. afermentans]WJY57046.1 Aminodeoxychorismate synthase component 1 [Corynebacterium afermentans subsp. afermentans]SIP91691.1 para-aminobenzoate synthetase [Corynebacterium afermentans]